MPVWRICATKHSDDAFSGKGGLYVAGRWHPRGIRVVYTAESLALATLEVFVHSDSDKIPLVAIPALLPEKTAMLEIQMNDLPENWQEISAYPVLQEIGKEWFLSQRTPVLKVPSAIVPVEYNYILNPTHPDFQILLEPPMKFQFDRRMWRRG